MSDDKHRRESEGSESEYGMEVGIHDVINDRRREIAEGRNLGCEEGIEEGEQRGRMDEKRTIYERLVSSGKLSPQEASMITGWNVNTVI